MPAHVFVSDRENFDICLQHGVVGIPSAAPGSRQQFATDDALISRMCIVRPDDFIFFYITGEKRLYGVWQADGFPFFDDAPVWPDKTYPYRVRIRSTVYSFPNALDLHDVLDLQNEGKLPNFSFKRASGTNAMFSLTGQESALLLNEYCKINPFGSASRVIPRPYPVIEADLLDRIHLDPCGQIKYEAGLMAYLLRDLTLGRHRELLGHYTDYLCYAPTTIGGEMDLLLTYSNPFQPELVSSYAILELKRGTFDRAALSQLIGYESWFLHKKVSGDQKMLRPIAIAHDFSDEVLQYVRLRTQIENKPIRLIRYALSSEKLLLLESIE